MSVPFYSIPENADDLRTFLSYHGLPIQDPSSWPRESVIRLLNLVADRSKLDNSTGHQVGDSIMPYKTLVKECGLTEDKVGIAHSLNSRVIIRKMELGISDEEVGAEYTRQGEYYLTQREHFLKERK